MMNDPIMFDWDGESMSPSSQFFQQKAHRQFEAGQRYKLVVVAERSDATHNHQFASLADQWDSLPDWLKFEFPSEEHLRKRALIMTGFCTMRDYVASSKTEALKLAAFLRPMDEYSMIQVEGAVVRVFNAMSQSRKAMPEKGQFQRSKTAVMDWVALLLEAPQVAMQRMGRAA